MLLLFNILPLPLTLSTLLTSFPLPRCSYHSPHSLDTLDVPEMSLLLLSSSNLFGATLHAPFNTCVASGLVHSSHHHLNVILDVLDISLLSSSINLPSRHLITSPASQPLPTTLPLSTPPQDLVFFNSYSSLLSLLFFLADLEDIRYVQYTFMLDILPLLL